MGRHRAPAGPCWTRLLRAGARRLLELCGTALRGLRRLWSLAWVLLMCYKSCWDGAFQVTEELGTALQLRLEGSEEEEDADSDSAWEPGQTGQWRGQGSEAVLGRLEALEADVRFLCTELGAEKLLWSSRFLELLREQQSLRQRLQELPWNSGDNPELLGEAEDQSASGSDGESAEGCPWMEAPQQARGSIQRDRQKMYFLRATVSRRLNDVVKEMDIVVHTLSTYPELNSSIKMEVGIEDCLHIEFEYNKSKYHLKDVIVGKIYFLLVRIKIKHMEIDIIKRETTGTGPNVYHENDTIAKYEIMDGAPVRGESIPIRLFLAGYELTPTMRDINKKFSVRYYLNLVLIDEEERRYFKQQEVVLWRKGDIVRKSMSHQAAIASQRFEGSSSHGEAKAPGQPADNNGRQ